MNDLSQWHSIRPWRPSLSLTVREITSVSATFLLSSALRSSADAAVVEQSLATLGLSTDEDSSDGDPSGSGPQIVSDVFSKGLSVKVNGTPWQRVLMRVDDDADEAVMIIFGLMPGRQYDIELGTIPNEKILRSQITTTNKSLHSSADADSAQGPSSSDTLYVDATHPPNTSQDQSLSSNDVEQAPVPAFSLEDRRLQLTHTLSLLTAEHTNLTSTLKGARRDAQKADAALRAEIDALRRASERSAPAELRAKQRALALQEAARQAQAAAEQVQERVNELEVALPDLEREREAIEREWAKVHKEAEAVRMRREEAEAKEKKRVDAKQGELAALTSRLEKLNLKKDKLEGENGLLQDLEERLKRLEEERERIEGDPYGYSYENLVADPDDELVSPVTDEGPQQPHAPGAHRAHYHGHHQHSHPRKRHTHPLTQKGTTTTPLQPIARPEPIQRPSPNPKNTTAVTANTGIVGPGVLHLHAHTSSLPSVGAVRNPPHAPSITGSTSGASSSNSSSPSPAHSHAHAVGPSLLSSRAPPFEPRSGSGTSSSASGAVRSELNPGSSPFEPRTASAGSAGKPSERKAPGAGRP